MVNTNRPSSVKESHSLVAYLTPSPGAVRSTDPRIITAKYVSTLLRPGWNKAAQGPAGAHTTRGALDRAGAPHHTGLRCLVYSASSARSSVSPATTTGSVPTMTS